MKTIKNTSKQTETNTQLQEIPAVKALNVKVRSICKNIIHSLIFFQTLKNSSPNTETNTQADTESENGSVEDRRSSFEIERPVLDSIFDVSDAVQPDGLDYQSEGPIDIPEDSVVDTESSDGQNHVYDDESDGDQEKDEDYVMDDASDKSESEKFNSDEEFDDNVCKPTQMGKGKLKVQSLFCPLISYQSLVMLITKTFQNLPKPQKGDFRRDINNARANSAIAGNTAKMKSFTAQKRKEPLGGNRPP